MRNAPNLNRNHRRQLEVVVAAKRKKHHNLRLSRGHAVLAKLNQIQWT
jgi:hypothetical protein